MQELGFIIDREGKISYFGEYAENYDSKNRHQMHDSSFTDEVENTEYFSSLKLTYNKERGIFGKAIDLSLQGMIMLLNITDKNIPKMMMYATKYPTENQKETLSTLYGLLNDFKEIKIITPSSEFIDSQDIFISVDQYFETYHIKTNLRL